MPFSFLCILFLDERFSHVLKSHGPRTSWAKNHVIYCSQMQIKTVQRTFNLLSFCCRSKKSIILVYTLLYVVTGRYSWKPFFPCVFFRKNKEDFLRNLARDNAQLLFNAIWKVRLILLTIIFCNVHMQSFIGFYIFFGCQHNASYT